MNKLFTSNLFKLQSTYLLHKLVITNQRNYSEMTRVLNNRLIIKEYSPNSHRLVLIQCRFKGHSKWQNIRHTKAAKDQEKGTVFNTLVRSIVKSVRKEGGDPHLNRGLANILEACRRSKMPKQTSDRAIARGLIRNTKPLQVELIGPNGLFIILDVEVERMDKFHKALRKILTIQEGFGYASEGYVKRCFENKGIIKVKINDKNGNQIDTNVAEEVAIEADAEDVFTDDDNDDKIIIFITDIVNFKKCKTYIEQNTNFDISESGIELVPLERVPIDDEVVKRFEQFTQKLDEIEDTIINNIYDNIA